MKENLLLWERVRQIITILEYQLHGAKRMEWKYKRFSRKTYWV